MGSSIAFPSCRTSSEGLQTRLGGGEGHQGAVSLFIWSLDAATAVTDHEA
jgi:hypothetical protein